MPAESPSDLGAPREENGSIKVTECLRCEGHFVKDAKAFDSLCCTSASLPVRGPHPKERIPNGLRREGEFRVAQRAAEEPDLNLDTKKGRRRW